MDSKVLELFNIPIVKNNVNWVELLQTQHCGLINRKCLKNRKSEPAISIGTCSVKYGKENNGIIICPHRLLEKQKIFFDSIHLLTLHEPGNDLHIVSEITIPGGSVDYFLVSAVENKVKDFVGIELQTLDTTGTIWPNRQRFLHSKGIEVKQEEIENKKSFGINWKMTAKTILVQLHHKIQTFENINKHLVLVLQDCLLDYMEKEFVFKHVNNAKIGDAMHFHSYQLSDKQTPFLKLNHRISTDAEGIAKCIGLQANANVKLEQIIKLLESKINDQTLLQFDKQLY